MRGDKRDIRSSSLVHLRDGVAQDYRLLVSRREALSVRTDYDAIVEAAKPETS